jgi:hypothetical protein
MSGARCPPCNPGAWSPFREPGIEQKSQSKNDRKIQSLVEKPLPAPAGTGSLIQCPIPSQTGERIGIFAEIRIILMI